MEQSQRLREQADSLIEAKELLPDESAEKNRELTQPWTFRELLSAGGAGKPKPVGNLSAHGYERTLLNLAIR